MVVSANNTVMTDTLPAVVVNDQKVMDQLEYYFGDINLTTDYFMRNALTDGKWLTLDQLMRFRRLNRLVGNSRQALVNVLKRQTSALFETNTAVDAIRRRADRPLPPAVLPVDRTVYILGFTRHVTIDDLLKWSEQFEGVLSVQMILFAKQKVVVLVFDDHLTANKMRVQPGLRYGGHDLLAKTKLEYDFRTKQTINPLKDIPLRRSIIPSAGQITASLVANKPVANKPMDKSLSMDSLVIKLTGFKRSVPVDRVKKWLTNAYGKVVYVGRQPAGHLVVQFANRSDGQPVVTNSDGNAVANGNGGQYPITIDGHSVTAQELVNEELRDFLNMSKEKILKSSLKKFNQQKGRQQPHKRSASLNGAINGAADGNAKRLTAN